MMIFKYIFFLLIQSERVVVEQKVNLKAPLKIKSYLQKILTYKPKPKNF